MNKKSIANIYFIAGLLFYNSLETLFSNNNSFWGIIKISIVIILMVITYNKELKNE
ncbi:hypothetical protein ACSXAY_19330 (plasmid) [Clostridium perfringens]